MLQKIIKKKERKKPVATFENSAIAKIKYYFYKF